jgi:Alpha/beta hydrolase domain
MMIRRPTRQFPLRGLLVVTLLVAGARTGHTECIELQIMLREPFAGGKAFGDTGPYERIAGIARFAIDPNLTRNHLMVDLTHAPRNAQGRVEFACDFFILAPKDPSKGNGAILYDVNNRGNKLALAFFNNAAGSNDPSTAEHAGDGFLFRRGYTVVWCGWIGELLPGGGRLLLQAPVAMEHGKPIVGPVRYEFSTDSAAESLPLSRRDGHGSYISTEKGEREGVLTWRMRESDERVSIPRGQWQLQRLPPEPVKDRVPGTLPQVRIKVAGGFRPGYLYELVCEAQDPIVQGCGFGTVRDLVSFLRYEGSDQNPLARDGKTQISRAHAFGVSQSGRFLRHFLYLGFNADERNRKVFDGVMPHVAGGGLGFFNHRFAQPTRHNAQHEEHLYPADVFPFTYGDCGHSYYDATGKLAAGPEIDGILRRLSAEDVRLLPKVMHTQTAAEYWHRSGSLVHTDPAGLKDVELPANVRLYVFGGAQHGPAADPPKPGGGDQLPNPANFKPINKALLDALDAWVNDGTEPPPSLYPRVDNGTLVSWRQRDTGFPALPAVRYPEVIQQPSFLDFGPHFARGIITCEPPQALGHYRVLVPKTDADGNDLGTLLPPEVAVPLATYTGWNLRRRETGAEGMLLNLTGSFMPFPRTEAERQRTGDPRVSIERRYGSFDQYEQRFRNTCEDYVRKRYLLNEDLEGLVRGRQKYRDWFVRGNAIKEK